MPLDQAQDTADFPLLHGGDFDIKDTIRAAFHQGQAAGLWKRATRKLIQTMIRKDGAVGIRIGQVFHEAIDGQQTQAKAKSRSRLGLGQRTSDARKERAQGRHSQLLAPLTEGTGGRHLLLQTHSLRQSFQQTAIHFARTAVGIEPQGHDQVDHGLHIQFVLTLLPSLALSEHLLDHLSRHDGETEQGRRQCRRVEVDAGDVRVGDDHIRRGRREVERGRDRCHRVRRG